MADGAGAPGEWQDRPEAGGRLGQGVMRFLAFRARRLEGLGRTFRHRRTEIGGVDVSVTRTDGTLSPMLYILDANSQQLTSAYPSDSKDSAQIQGYNLPGPGKYLIVIGRENDQGGDTNGKYRVMVSASAQQ